MAQLKLFDIGKLVEFEPFDLAAELQTQLRRAVEHCQAQPGDKRVRKVVLQVELSPVMDGTGDVTHCEVSFQCNARLPARRTGTLLMGLKKNGSLTYSPESEGDGDAA